MLRILTAVRHVGEVTYKAIVLCIAAVLLWFAGGVSAKPYSGPLTCYSDNPSGKVIAETAARILSLEKQENYFQRIFVAEGNNNTPQKLVFLILNGKGETALAEKREDFKNSARSIIRATKNPRKEEEISVVVQFPDKRVAMEVTSAVE